MSPNTATHPHIGGCVAVFVETTTADEDKSAVGIGIDKVLLIPRLLLILLISPIPLLVPHYFLCIFFIMGYIFIWGIIL